MVFRNLYRDPFDDFPDSPLKNELLSLKRLLDDSDIDLAIKRGIYQEIALLINTLYIKGARESVDAHLAFERFSNACRAHLGKVDRDTSRMIAKLSVGMVIVLSLMILAAVIPFLIIMLSITPAGPVGIIVLLVDAVLVSLGTSLTTLLIGSATLAALTAHSLIKSSPKEKIAEVVMTIEAMDIATLPEVDVIEVTNEHKEAISLGEKIENLASEDPFRIPLIKFMQALGQLDQRPLSDRQALEQAAMTFIANKENNALNAADEFQQSCRNVLGDKAERDAHEEKMANIVIGISLLALVVCLTSNVIIFALPAYFLVTSVATVIAAVTMPVVASKTGYSSLFFNQNKTNEGAVIEAVDAFSGQLCI